jgi:N-methylhydantoinase B
MRADRPAELPVFDMGPPVEELLARCEEETGLPAPKRPVWAAG